MKVFLAEYTVCHDPALALEGRAMLRVLEESYTRCGYEVVKPEKGDFAREIERIAPLCDMGLVIAPDHLLALYTNILENATHNLGCGSMSVALCANKQKTGKILAGHGIPVPGEGGKGLRVIKPIRGCGSQGVRLSADSPGPEEFSQQYIEGDHLSVSLIGGRVVGEACLYYKGRPPLVLAINRQYMEIAQGIFTYRGGETPVHHVRGQEIVDTAARAVQILGCQGYVGVDVVVSDQVYVVDVNPRITTSLVGIVTVMEEEIADLLVQASRGEVPAEVHLRGRVRFTREGEVSDA
ncbi:MAG: ATP-grasp domain-containing protein [Methanomicrobiales archaeon]|nr:ATP-grasp domain-containing protein [Methanomicrobiales archaeon]